MKPAAYFYSIISKSAMIKTMLHTTLKELMVAERPLSSFSSAVNTGVAEAKGAKHRITSALRTSSSKGSRK